MSYPDEGLPEGSVIDGTHAADVDLEADFVVVGTGASGAVAGRELAAHGHRVVFVEEGPWVKTRDFVSDVETTFARLLRDGGLQAMRGRSFIPMLQGRAVGGSTVVNSAIAWRLPDDVLHRWRTEFGLAGVADAALLEPHYEALERALHVRSVDEAVLGQNNRLFLEGARAMGIAAAPMRRYDDGCSGSGRCLQGCPSAGKQGMNVTFVPDALRHGARIVHDASVLHVETTGARATGVRARTAFGQEISIQARHGVMLAASTVQTPGILRRSGLRNAAIGQHFQCHPGHGVAGRFERPVHMDFGAVQGAESVHFRQSHGFKLEALAMPPELAAARVPGVGEAFRERLADWSHLAVWVAQFRAEAQGTVDRSWTGAERVRFTPSENDMKRLRFACATLVRLFFEAGAREVWPGIHGVPQVLSSIDQADLVERGPLDPRAYGMVASHLFGAARMAPDRRAGVVGLDFQTHEVERLYVIDSSVFPTNLGVNPQHGIMAMSRLCATRAADRVRASHAA